MAKGREGMKKGEKEREKFLKIYLYPCQYSPEHSCKFLTHSGDTMGPVCVLFSGYLSFSSEQFG